MRGGGEERRTRQEKLGCEKKRGGEEDKAWKRGEERCGTCWGLSTGISPSVVPMVSSTNGQLGDR